MEQVKDIDEEAGLRYEFEHLLERISSKCRMLDWYAKKINELRPESIRSTTNLQHWEEHRKVLFPLKVAIQVKVSYLNSFFKYWCVALNTAIETYTSVNSLHKSKSCENHQI